MICINDNDFDGDFNIVRDEINRELDRLYPNKCSFEI